MSDISKLCYGCMEIKPDDGECPYCGYKKDSPYLPAYLAPGTMLNDRYVVGKLLFCNGESAVYLAFDSVIEKKVWLKEYMPDALCKRVKGTPTISVSQGDVVQYKTLMCEFTELNKTLAKMRTLNHINPALELFAENNTTYVVFDIIKGCTLEEYLSNNSEPMTWEQSRRLIPPIFTTLSLVHNAGLVHRGISPSTVWVENDGGLKISGFCISAERSASSMLAPELFSGYSAPEQYSTVSWQGTWTDVYSVCAMLYRMLTGVVPVDAISRMANDTLEPPIKVNNSIPSHISKVIMQGLSVSGDSRIQTVTELVTALFDEPVRSDGGPNKTQTIILPKLANSYSSATSSSSRANGAVVKMSNARTLILVFIITLAILSAAMILTFKMMYPPTDPVTSAATTESLPTETGALTDSSETSYAIDPEPALLGGNIVTESSEEIKKKETFEIPSFAGKNFDLIQNSDTYKNWLVFVPTFEYSEEVSKGTVMEQSIAEGTLVESGASIELKISKGSKMVPVPEYKGLKDKEYLAALDEAGIKYETVKQKNPEYLDGYVIGTSVEPGIIIDVSVGEILKVYICDGSETDVAG